MKRASTVMRWLLVGGCGAAVLLCASVVALSLWILAPTSDRDNRDPAKQQEMPRVALRIDDLAPIPQGARIAMIRTDGNQFSRSFRVVFHADPKAIRRWLKASPGIGSAVEVTRSGGKTIYRTRPKQGDLHGRVIVYGKGDRVEIYACHS